MKEETAALLRNMLFAIGLSRTKGVRYQTTEERVTSSALQEEEQSWHTGVRG